jgi:hypothetical protein
MSLVEFELYRECLIGRVAVVCRVALTPARAAFYVVEPGPWDTERTSGIGRLLAQDPLRARVVAQHPPR